jgi:hypothetical protein
MRITLVIHAVKNVYKQITAYVSSDSETTSGTPLHVQLAFYISEALRLHLDSVRRRRRNYICPASVGNIY